MEIYQLSENLYKDENKIKYAGNHTFFCLLFWSLGPMHSLHNLLREPSWLKVSPFYFVSSKPASRKEEDSFHRKSVVIRVVVPNLHHTQVLPLLVKVICHYFWR